MTINYEMMMIYSFKKLISFMIMISILSNCSIVGHQIGKIGSKERYIPEPYIGLQKGHLIVITKQDQSKIYGSFHDIDRKEKIIILKDESTLKQILIPFSEIALLRDKTDDDEDAMTGFKYGLIVDGVIVVGGLLLLNGLAGAH
jgi:hypothetical protein